MSNELSNTNRRVLVIDDNHAIHEDFRKILCRESKGANSLAEAEAQIFGDVVPEASAEHFQIDSAFQGEEGCAMVRRALDARQPYAVAFVDIRMPPGWDGVETAARIWEIDPDIQIVICTAYSDYSWKQMRTRLGNSDRLVILKKPFDTIEVLQLAHSLAHKWQRAADGNRHLAALQRMIRARSNALNGRSSSWQIDEQELAMAAQAANTQVRQHLVLEDELRRAIEAGEITVHYQPLIEIASQRIVSVEALARWRHPEKGWIAPATFIPIAETSGLVLALGEHVLKTACEQIVEWELDGTGPMTVAVNISAVQLCQQDIVELVRRVVHQTHMQPHHLVLEITESSLIENLQQHTSALEALRRDGVGIEIDDFGTGYSSLSYLRALPIDAVKIDRSFIRQIDTNPVDAAIVSAIVAMAHSMQLRVVAEGVETPSQLKVLGAQGCDVAQGFLFARPLPADDCRKLLTAIAQRQTFTDTLRALATGSAS
jgi:EAL domain-containing protein (putative c-di-GMP-specific phosphodiesterase class I)/DNA-binding NarL/FixJ family response regulator